MISIYLGFYYMKKMRIKMNIIWRNMKEWIMSLLVRGQTSTIGLRRKDLVCVATENTILTYDENYVYYSSDLSRFIRKSTHYNNSNIVWSPNLTTLLHFHINFVLPLGWMSIIGEREFTTNCIANKIAFHICTTTSLKRYETSGLESTTE